MDRAWRPDEAHDLRAPRRAAARGRRACQRAAGEPAPVSQHLKVLKEAGLVVDRPAGNRRIYQLDPAGLGALRAQLDEFWTKALANFKAAAGQRTEEGS